MSDHNEIWKKMTTPKTINVAYQRPFSDVENEFNRLVSDGVCVKCPLSGTIHNMPYRRAISKGMARAIKLLYRIQVSKINDGTAPNQFADFTKLRYWGLIQQAGETSHWNITQAGIDFVEGRTGVAKKAIVVNNVRTQFMGERVYIDEILKK